MKVCCIKTADIAASAVSGTGAFAVPFSGLFETVPVYWIERAQAEQDTAYKQIIPYIITSDAQGLFACYPRHGSETRLHGLYSCGIGGHIDEADKAETLLQTIKNGMHRELSEEFTNFDPDRLLLTYKGVIHETETKVGLVHLGIVFSAQCTAGFTPAAGEELAGLQWRTYSEIMQLKLERWTELAFKLFQPL